MLRPDEARGFELIIDCENKQRIYLCSEIHRKRHARKYQ